MLAHPFFKDLDDMMPIRPKQIEGVEEFDEAETLDLNLLLRKIH